MASNRDVKYEALSLLGLDEKDYWTGVIGGSANASVRDIKYDGIIIGLGFSDLKDYYDDVTGEASTSLSDAEYRYWMKVIEDNT